jgi:hypothetical protein
MPISNRLLDKLGIDVNKPNFIVLIILTIVVAIEVFLICNNDKTHDDQEWQNLDGYVFVFTWFGLLTTPIVEWLRNIYVFIGWIFVCSLWLLYKVDEDFLSAILPLSVLVYSQISRLIFKSLMGYHPIHLLFHQYPVHRYSKLNKRKSTIIDYKYSMLYSIVGLVVSIVVGIYYVKK